MSDKELSYLLDETLEWISETGECIESAASRHPEHFDELLELLETYEVLHSCEQPSLRSEFRDAARTRLMNRIDVLEKTASTDSVTKKRSIRHIWRTNGNRRFAMTWIVVIGMIISLIAGGSGVAYASSDALPGDALYGVKTGLQDLKLTFSTDENDIDLLLENMEENLVEMYHLANQGRFGDFQIGLDEYEENLQALVRTRARISYEDAGTEESLNNRIQQQLELHGEVLEALQTQTNEQLKLKLQEAIQLTEQGKTYGPNDGGKPESPGSPNGAGPGEPEKNNQQPEGAGSGSEQDSNGNKNQGPGSGQGQGQNSGAGYGIPGPNGEIVCTCLEEDAYCVMGEVQNEFGEVLEEAVCTCAETGYLCGEAQEFMGQGMGQQSEGSSGNGQGGKP